MKKVEFLEYILTIIFQNGQKKEYRAICDQISFYLTKWKGNLSVTTSPKELCEIQESKDFLDTLSLSIWKVEDLELFSLASIAGISIRANYYKGNEMFKREYAYNKNTREYMYLESGKRDSLLALDDLSFNDVVEAKKVEEVSIPAFHSKRLEAYLCAVNAENVIDGSEIRIPEGVRYIEKHTFKGVKEIEKLHISTSIEYIDPYAFSNIYHLKEVTSDNSIYIVQNNRLMDIRTSQYLTFGEEGNAKMIVGVKDTSIPLDLPYSHTILEDAYIFDSFQCEFEKNNIKTESYELFQLIMNTLGKRNCCIFLQIQDMNNPSMVTYYYWDSKEIIMGTKENWKEKNILNIKDWMSSFGISCSKKRTQNLSQFKSSLFDFTRREKKIVEKELKKIQYSTGSFKNDFSIEEIIVETKVLSKETFKNCTSLKKIFFKYVEIIEEGAFENCIDLKEVTFPDSLTRLESNCFKGCSNLKRVSFGKNTEVIEKSAFQDSTSLESVYLNPTITRLGPSAFKGCQLLTEIHLPQIEVIEEETFYGCYGLKKVILPESLKRIEHRAFGKCESLSELINIENNQCSYIATGAFKDSLFNKETRMSTKEQEIYIGKYLWFSNKKETRIKESTLAMDRYSLGNIEKLYIPKSLSVIDVSICRNKDTLKSIEFEEGVTTILKDVYGGTFENCSNVEEVIWPVSLILVHPDTFKGCKNMCVNVYPGSYGEAYCKRNDIKCRCI